MKPVGDYLKTSLWYREQIDDPYQVIADFFSAGDMAYHKKCIKLINEAAVTDKIWRANNPGDVLYEFKLIESIINAAYIIIRQQDQVASSYKHTDMFDTSSYCPMSTPNREWDFFPRFLSFREFGDPYKTFRHFFKYMELEDWKNELQVLLDHALVSHSIFQSGIEMNTLFVFFQLTKLVEAAHLINVRR